MYRAVIIDDEKWVIKSLIAILNKHPNLEIVGEAYNGPSGLDLITRNKPDIVFIDIKMPGFGGLEILQKVNELDLPSVCIIISGHAEFAYAQKAMSQNAIGYCLKPFSPSEINDALDRACRIIEEKRSGSAEAGSLSKTPGIENNLMNEINSLDSISAGSISTENELVKKILACIHKRFDKNISIQQLAQECNVNANYASQLFNQEVGEKFNLYLTKLRLDKAQQLLRETNLPVSNIASMSGYNDYFYFAKVFKKSIGMTPKEYRSQERSNT
jgi:two-component system response regulator YesN